MNRRAQTFGYKLTNIFSRSALDVARAANRNNVQWEKVPAMVVISCWISAINARKARRLFNLSAPYQFLKLGNGLCSCCGNGISTRGRAVFACDPALRSRDGFSADSAVPLRRINNGFVAIPAHINNPHVRIAAKRARHSLPVAHYAASFATLFIDRRGSASDGFGYRSGRISCGVTSQLHARATSRTRSAGT